MGSGVRPEVGDGISVQRYVTSGGITLYWVAA
jgi:hypothetical protein